MMRSSSPPWLAWYPCHVSVSLPEMMRVIHSGLSSRLGCMMSRSAFLSSRLPVSGNACSQLCFILGMRMRGRALLFFGGAYEDHVVLFLGQPPCAEESDEHGFGRWSGWI